MKETAPMETTLVNQVYLEQLKSLASEQNESSFVAHLIDHLQIEYVKMLENESGFLKVGQSFDQEILNLLHRLKNSFSNLGAEPASRLLDQLHHSVANQKICDSQIGTLWMQFRETADRTMEQLGHLK